MSISLLKRVLFSALFLAAHPALALAQAAPAEPAAAPQAVVDADADAPQLSPQEQEMQAWYTELQELHGRLEQVQEQALGDAELAARQQELGNEIRLAMATRDSTMEGRMTRMSAIETEASAAQQAGNMQRLQELMIEANDIQEHLMHLQQEVIEEPGMAAKLSTFQQALQQKMVQLDPQAQQMMDRFRDLESKLTAAVGAGF